MKLFLVRHGQTETNVQRLVCGQMDTPLTPLGEAQSAALSGFIELSPVSFERLYVSPLQRAVKSASLFLANGHFEIVADLMETNTGSYSELTVDELHDIEPRFERHGCYPELRYPGGESIHDLYCRITEWFKGVERDPLLVNANILVVGHGGTVNCLLHYLLGEPLDTYPAFDVENASLTIVDSSSEGASLELYNHTEAVVHGV